ncbi:uncharacterized protein LOC121262392 isoform X1 [Juglans microcarpa x Juglans regia]|uniref:uncharacterized protein LOC121262392 isoform X1 n=1 Tax=Juglans microcarpa x Juglans regia TaxID=2249226 RepID=UPI001B7E808E|nr:uncharacterized protein LOC121262392 isoform X1 [Juglans microcarpa x Juglans regia]
MAILLSLPPHPPNPPQNPNSATTKPISLTAPKRTSFTTISKRHFLLKTTSLSIISLSTLSYPVAHSSAEPSVPPKPALSGIANTKSWFQFFGDGFAIRIPPQFEDITEPEDYTAGLSLYGDKAKPKTFAARFASSDGSEVLSVVIRPTNQLKITFLEAKDITDLGSLKEAAKIFVPGISSPLSHKERGRDRKENPKNSLRTGYLALLSLAVVFNSSHAALAGGSNLYSARTLKIKEEEGLRTYYFYEFGRDEQHVALVAAVNSGKAIIAGATAPQSKWDDDGVRLRSAAVSLTVL